jgi:hypothetical protein
MATRSRNRAVAFGLALLTISAMATAQAPMQGDSPPLTRDRTAQQVRDGAASQARNSDIYGYQLMTERERTEFRERRRAADTEQERDRIQAEHHAQMQARAKERGVTLSGPKVSGRSGQWAKSADADADGK